MADRLTIDDLRAEAASSGRDPFAKRYPDPLIIGRGMVSVPLPDPSNPGTLALNPADGLNMQTIQQSRAIKGRVFWLRTSEGDRVGSQGTPRVTLGRDRRCDIVLPDFPISGQHCWFVRARDGGIEVVDGDSTNGTFVNEARCEPRQRHRIADGDSIVFGRFAFEYWSSVLAALA